MFKKKKIKLKGSSFFKRHKPLNGKSKSSRVVVSNGIKGCINKTRKKKVSNKKNTVVKPLNNHVDNNKRYLPDIIEKRFVLLAVIIMLSFVFIAVRLFKLQVTDGDKYKHDLVLATEKVVDSSSAPRGRIYDRNHKLLVDNRAVKTIYYKKENGISSKKEVELAYKVSDMIDVDYNKLSEKMLKTFWIVNNREIAKKKVTDKEYQKYEERKLNDSDLEKLIYERITSEELEKYDDRDRETAYIYYLMNKGYSYSEKIIKNNDVSDSEYAIISENIDNLSGFNTKLGWEREYIYGDLFKSIYGNVSSSNQGIPSELSDEYIKNGYSLDDRVGISYLEYQYEGYLKGTKAKYKINYNNDYELISEGKRGNDIVLTIDIELQKYLEEVLSQEVLNAKSENNTKFYDHSFVVVADPRNGEILAMAGKQVKEDSNGNYYVADYTPGIIIMSVTPGSIVKGASMLVGYKYGAIDIGEYQVDECIKIKATPEKCSWRTMGYINDISALAFSSNVYQYKIAIKIGKGVYRYDEALSIDEDAFNKYRNMYASFGLGVKTEIDLPVEGLGYVGKSKLPGHLLDFAIGQYDTYTPIEISQYISTLANGGKRYKPYLLKEVYEPSTNKEDAFGKKIYESKSKELGNVDVDQKYIERVKDGFRAVVEYGLGTQYMGDYQEIGAGKTGTSQSFIDSDGDGKVDTETISTSFVGYAPYNNPKMSIVVVSPDIATSDSETTSGINKRISSQIVNKYFEINK